MTAEQIHPLRVVSVLTQYPDQAAVDAAGRLDPAEVGPLKPKPRKSLGRFLDWYRGHSVAELQGEYVDTFDFDRQRSLHMTYHIHGDSRQRGLALLQIKSAYREAGFEVSDSELPDFLPVMLEFAALAEPPHGRDLLERHRPSIELIRESLRAGENPWAGLFDLIRDGLPSLSSRQVARIRRLAENGPPSEEVGLEPFAPPEVMPTEDGQVPLPMVGGRE